MKKFWKYIAACAVVASLVPLTACDDDDTVEPYDINYCYLYQPHTSYAALEYKATGDFISTLDDPLKLVPVRLTKPAPKDITVTVELDPAAVEEYNAANNKDYKYLEGAQLVNPTMHIAAGEYITPDSITISFADRSFLVNNTDDLILPVVIKDAQGIQVSKSSRIFLIFNYKSNLVELNSSTTRILEKDWATALGSLKVAGFLSADWAADEAITVQLSVDPTLVEGYNSTNGTDCALLPGATVPSTVTIAKGEGNADLPVTISSTNIEIKDYVLPIRATAISGTGAELANEIAYVAVKSTPGTCSLITSAASLGSVFSCANWNVKVNGESTFTDEDGTYDWTSLLNNYGDAGISYWSVGDVILVDLGEEKTITGFECRFYAWYYAVNSFTSVKTSANGTRWSDWGPTEGNFAYTANEIFKFENPTTCRYIELTVGQPSYSSAYGTVPTGMRFYAE